MQMVTVGGEGEALTQLLSALPLAYMAACCYYSLFQLGMFSFYHVVPHATNAHSLLMNAAQVCCFLHEHHGPCSETCNGHTVSCCREAATTCCSSWACSISSMRCPVPPTPTLSSRLPPRWVAFAVPTLY